jgi:hypothetical protein
MARNHVYGNMFRIILPRFTLLLLIEGLSVATIFTTTHVNSDKGNEGRIEARVNVKNFKIAGNQKDQQEDPYYPVPPSPSPSPPPPPPRGRRA